MKTLYLIKQAKAEKTFEIDHERPLSETGKEEAKILGKFLKNIEVKPSIIVSSTAQRALNTAHIIAKKIEVTDEKIIPDKTLYNITANELCQYIATFDDRLNYIMLVGHNPAIEEALSTILGNVRINMTTASVAAIEINCASWNGFSNHSYLSFFINSELVKKLF